MFYLANFSHRHVEFQFRTHASGVRTVPIAISEQIGLDLTELEIEEIMTQHRIYGLVDFDKGLEPNFSGLAYRRDIPFATHRII